MAPLPWANPIDMNLHPLHMAEPKGRDGAGGGHVGDKRKLQT